MLLEAEFCMISHRVIDIDLSALYDGAAITLISTHEMNEERGKQSDLGRTIVRNPLQPTPCRFFFV